MPTSDEAGRLNVSPGTPVAQHAYAGRAIGAQLINRAAPLVTDSGRAWLRLDCRELGFAHVRSVDFPHRTSAALFQRVAPESRRG